MRGHKAVPISDARPSANAGLGLRVTTHLLVANLATPKAGRRLGGGFIVARSSALATSIFRSGSGIGSGTDTGRLTRCFPDEYLFPQAYLQILDVVREAEVDSTTIFRVKRSQRAPVIRGQ